jgi:hypothetical protein
MIKREIKNVFIPTELNARGAIALEFLVGNQQCTIQLAPKDIMRMQKIMHANARVLKEEMMNHAKKIR